MDPAAQTPSAFLAFVEAHVLPRAGAWDQAEAVPREVIEQLAAAGYLGATLPPAFGGQGMSQVTYGLLTEAIGRGCSSLRTLLTVHLSLVAETLLRWGTTTQQETWLPALARGSQIAAFALSEPEVGSDANSIQATYTSVSDGFRLSGKKKWISFGQIADVFLTFARGEDGISAFLVPARCPGVRVSPLRGILGTRASLLAEIHFEQCVVPTDHLLGKEGWGFLQIANTALDNGRYSVACGSLGIVRACLEESLRFASTRSQFGKPLREHQLIQRRLTELTRGAATTALLCREAGAARDARNPSAIYLTSLAKYVAADEAKKASDHAVQIHGAQGCHADRPIERYYRDARIMEIIEGSTELQQSLLAHQAEVGLQHFFPSS